ncbi:MAG: hypothetical protein CMN30_09650 [Sandaracinus sp.]|nr:hypothetical protein [Sandaracinus sp.]
MSVVGLLILAAAGGVGLLAYGSSQRIVDQLWTRYASQLAEATTQRTLRLFEPAPPYVAMTRDAALGSRLDLGPFNEAAPPGALLDHLRAALEAHPEFSWTSFGSADGTYVAVHRDPEGATRGVWRTILDEGRTRMRELVPDPDAIEGGQRWGWRTVSTRDDGDYDPRARPWYQAATGAEDGVWVEPFVFATLGEPGFMYARAHVAPGDETVDGPGPDVVRGVWAVEYETRHLSEFLARLDVGEEGRVYLVSRSGEVIGHPAGETTTGADDALSIARAEGHPDPMLAAAWAAARDGDLEVAREVEAGELLVMSHPLPADSGIDWNVLVAVPEAEFFAPVRAQARTTAIAALVAALLAILCGVFFSSRISGALRVLADELERIGRFDVAPRDLGAAESFVREVNDMQDTTLRMKSSLRSFGKYIPKEVVRSLLLEGVEADLGGRQAELTMLFSDIAGFTSVAETMDPDDLVAVLAEYLEGLSDAIRSHRGTVDKYIGDAIMAFWGAPQDDADHVRHACEGALAMKARLAELQASWDARGLPRLETRIGLNTGDVLVGNFGAATRLNYTVMGDPVNLASRLENLNKRYGTGIIVGQATAERVKEHFVFRPLEWVAVKGKSQGVLIHELVGRRGEVDDAALAAIAAYRDALELYRARRFAEAAAAFDALEPLHAGDLAPALMAEQARHFAAEPPPESWDGSTSMSTK